MPDLPSENRSSESSESSPTTRKRRRWPWVVLGLFGLSFLSLALCCGGIFLLSHEMIGVPFVDQVNAIAEVTTRAGRVDRVSVDIPATLSSFNEYPGHLVIEAHGSDGATSLLIEQSDDAKILTAYLYDPDGNHEKVFPSEADRN